jgi:dehydrogenase/reductase SDR family member 1
MNFLSLEAANAYWRTGHATRRLASAELRTVTSNGGNMKGMYGLVATIVERSASSRCASGAPFWEQPRHRWASMIDAGVRAAYVCSARAARLMVAQRTGLIVNISFWAAQKRIGNALYGISKAATDKLTSDVAEELAPFGVAAISLYPGLVRTEAVVAAAASGAFDLANSESPEFIGNVVAGLYKDPSLMKRSGRALIAASIAAELGVMDIDGSSPRALTIVDV